jgi:hypothetical protein
LLRIYPSAPDRPDRTMLESLGQQLRSALDR